MKSTPVLQTPKQKLLSARRFSGHCGCSSGVERNLAKVEVVSSNLITRSNQSPRGNASGGFVFARKKPSPDHFGPVGPLLRFRVKGPVLNRLLN